MNETESLLLAVGGDSTVVLACTLIFRAHDHHFTLFKLVRGLSVLLSYYCMVHNIFYPKSHSSVRDSGCESQRQTTAITIFTFMVNWMILRYLWPVATQVRCDCKCRIVDFKSLGPDNIKVR